MNTHRVTKEGTSPYKESYTVKHPEKCSHARFGGCWRMHQIWKSEFVHSFFIFSLYVSYTIFLNKASYVLGFTRIFRHQSGQNITSQTFAWTQMLISHLTIMETVFKQYICNWFSSQLCPILSKLMWPKCIWRHQRY